MNLVPTELLIIFIISSLFDMSTGELKGKSMVLLLLLLLWYYPL